VFVKVGGGSDGSGGVQAKLQWPARGTREGWGGREVRWGGCGVTVELARAWRPLPHARPGSYTVVPSVDQTSTLVRTRETTSLVKPLVVAWPPRSGVRTPAAVASSTDS
jgi:hypothetical protein